MAVARHLLSVSRLYTLAILICSLMGCQSLNTDRTVLTAFTPLVHTGAQYQELAQNSTTTEQRFRYQLLSARAYHQEQQMTLAYQLLQNLRATTLQPEQIVQIELVHAQLLSQENDFAAAITQMTFEPESVPPALKQLWHREKMRLYDLLEQPLLAAREAIWLDPWLDESLKENNTAQIWQRLSDLSPLTLRAFQSYPAPDPVTGWLELAALFKSYESDRDALASALDAWQKQYPNHPAKKQIQERQKALSHFQPYQPKHIGVLLPLSGAYQAQADALQAGILSAFKKSPQSTTEISFFDTQTQSMTDILSAVKNTDIDFIIGPLLKQDVENYLNADSPYPTLILNESSSVGFNTKQKNYFFSISLRHELEQAADQIALESFHSPLIFAANTTSNRKHIQAFQKRWQIFHDTPAEVYFFDDFNHIRTTVEKALHLENSIARIRSIRSATRLPLHAEPRSRRDIDVIYLLGSSEETRMLKSFINVGVNTEATPPKLFSSSRAHELSKSKRHDLEDIFLTEMPWFLSSHDSLKKQVKQLWPHFTSSQWRLFAMGFDAFDLIAHLAHMEVIPTYGYTGLTGEMHVTPEQTLQRTLTWGRYQRGGAIAYVRSDHTQSNRPSL